MNYIGTRVNTCYNITMEGEKDENIRANQIVKEEQLREQLLKDKMTTTDEDMYLTCTMVNLNIVASKFDIDPTTVCMCIAPLGKINENILVV